MKKRIQHILSITLFTLLIAGCSGGSSTSTSTNSYASISVPTTTYQDSLTASKFAVYTKAGNGASTLTEIDTGSYFYVIESSYVGSDITMTNESITLNYDHGNVQRSGFIGYTNVAFLSQSGSTIISTNSQLPVVVVPDGVINNDPTKNHAIMGMRVNNEVSVKLFLPYPYNQMFILDAPKQKLTFGNFSPVQLSNFGMVQLPESACANANVATSAVANCWNDMAVPVNYTSTYQGVQTETMLNSLFDSGASSNFQYDPLPSWLNVNSSGEIENQIMASLSTNLGNLNIPLNQPTAGVVSNTNGGLVNVGNNIFNFYAVLFDQQNGRIGLNNVTASDSVTVHYAW